MPGTITNSQTNRPILKAVEPAVLTGIKFHDFEKIFFVTIAWIIHELLRFFVLTANGR